MRTKNGHVYIGFDNGCFDLVAQYHGHVRTYTIASPELNPARSKDLFGGIDVCGPTAGKLSLGFDYQKIGPFADDYQPKLTNVEHRVDPASRTITGTIMDVDSFGNATTNIIYEDLEAVGIRIGQTVTLKFSAPESRIYIAKTYGDVTPNQPVAIIHDELLQLAVNQGSFQKKFSVARGSTFEIKR